MTEEEYYRKGLVKRIVDHPAFLEIKKEIRSHIMEEMMLEKVADKRNELFWEAQALDRVMGRLVAIANEVRVEEKTRAA